MVLNVSEDFYMKPDAGLLLSPADATEADTSDAQAEELDIAIAIDRIQQATTLDVKRVCHNWACQCSFVADSSPVVGFDPIPPAFFWMAGLGGYGTRPRSRCAVLLHLSRSDARSIAILRRSASTLPPCHPIESLRKRRMGM